MIAQIQGLVAAALICAGVGALFGWPWALIVAGVLLLIDRITT